MTRAITERAKALVREFEGFRDKAYLCPAGVWTIGYGHTRGVTEGMVCDKPQAELWLTNDLFDAAASLQQKIGEDVVLSLTDNQHDALCDFVFNLGAGPGWTIWDLLRKRAYDQVPAQLSRFVYTGKTKLNGLVRRRNAEIALWSEAEPGSVDQPISSAEARVVDTPPAAAPSPLSPAHIGAVAVASVGGVAEGAKQVTAIIQPYAAQSPVVQHALTYAATVGAGAAVALALLAYLSHRKAAR